MFLVAALLAGSPTVEQPHARGAAARQRDGALVAVEQRLAEQQARLAHAESRVADLERVTPKEFEVIHYNVLADQAGTNMQPWFCYGADLTLDERRDLLTNFYASGDTFKRMPDKGWPLWAIDVLSPERIKAVEEYDAEIFQWERRRERLFAKVASHQVGCRVRSPDIITLAECDHFDDFWQARLEQLGYESMWRKRPRKSARDGCAIAWRASTFECVASSGFDFGSKLGSDDLDRTCCFALLRWRRDPSVRLLVATTHLARNPESEAAQMARGFQYGSIFRELLAFAGAHDAEEVPVVLTGDLNAKDCDELAGIARALVRLLESPTHPLLWSVMDAPTPPTTITEERHLRIDYLLYQSASLALTGVGNVPQLTEPIPNEAQPSDHLPVSARLVLKPHWAQVEEDARQWLAAVSGTTSVRPLSGDALRLAFTFFDRDASGLVSLVQLEAGMQNLGFPGLDSNFVRDALTRAGCGRSAGEAGRIHPDAAVLSRRALDDRSWAMDLDQFVKVYTHAVMTKSSAMGRQLEKAFAAFDLSGSGVLRQDELKTALRRMASAPLDEEHLDQVLRELSGGDTEARDLAGGNAPITIASFSKWMMSTYASYLRDPSLVHDSVSKWPDFHVYNQ